MAIKNFDFSPLISLIIHLVPDLILILFFLSVTTQMSLKAFENYHLSQGFITLNWQAHMFTHHTPKDISGFSQIKIIFKSAVAKTLWNHQNPLPENLQNVE